MVSLVNSTLTPNDKSVRKIKKLLLLNTSKKYNCFLICQLAELLRDYEVVRRSAIALWATLSKSISMCLVVKLIQVNEWSACLKYQFSAECFYLWWCLIETWAHLCDMLPQVLSLSKKNLMKSIISVCWPSSVVICKMLVNWDNHRMLPSIIELNESAPSN